jgi:eukaryotic-like serine/threonine-protein kinase
VTLHTGTRLGPYEIVSPIGAGGMGEVYRARDTTLNRDVALKVLPDAFASDPDRLARFEREAQVLASLNHPNIAAIYGLQHGPADAVSGVSGTMRALVLELVDGPTLADQILNGAIPLDEALPIARQIADALDAAHEQGVVHRYLKPANIKVRSDGTVKVLDFGLAKALEPVGSGSGQVSQSPTITSPAMTRAGMVLGTAAYMSPEQARGRAADKRSDVWAFGCVLYEMLTGARVFDADGMSDTIAAVLRAEPNWTRLRPDVPEPIVTLLKRCLEKDHPRRLRDIGDARLELDDAQRRGGGTASAPSLGRRARLGWLTAVAVLSLVVMALAATLAAWATRAMPAAAEVRLNIDTPGVSDPLDLASLAVSPDGLNVAFVAAVDGQPHVWVRSLDSVVARPLPGTGGASLPFWSADSRSVAFYADSSLKRIDLAGGLVRVLAKAAFGYGGAWNRDGTILLVQTPDSPILRTSADGANPTPVTRLAVQQTSHAHPHFLPDGRHFLYFVQGTPEVRGVYVGELDGPLTRKLFDADSAAVYTSGHLLFVRRTRLFAQPFDVSRLEPIGAPFPIADDVSGSQLAGVSASAGGVLAFRTGTVSVQRQFVWFDRSGKEIGTVGDRDTEKLSPSASPDLGQVAFFSRVNDNVDIFRLETRRNVLSRFTDHVAVDLVPVWSRDGGRIAFYSDRNDEPALYQKSTTGRGNEELLLRGEATPSDWSPGDNILLYQRNNDLWALPMRGTDRKPFPVMQTEFEEREGKFSPNGRWLAYVSNSSGRFEVFVQGFPVPGQTVPVSTHGGAQVQWRANGRELFYIALDGKLMAVSIDAPANGQSITPGIPVPLFNTRVGRIVGPGVSGPNYVVSVDGQRFLMSTLAQAGSAAPIRLIVNWQPPR